MKKIISLLIIILIQTLNLKAEDFKLNQIISGLNSPWSLTFKNQNEILMTEKSGQILFINIKDKTNNFSSNLRKENAAYAAIGFRNIPELDLISENIFNFIFHSNPLTSGNSIYLDYGQHFTDSFWSARIAADNKYD